MYRWLNLKSKRASKQPPMVRPKRCAAALTRRHRGLLALPSVGQVLRRLHGGASGAALCAVRGFCRSATRRLLREEVHTAAGELKALAQGLAAGSEMDVELARELAEVSEALAGELPVKRRRREAAEEAVGASKVA